MFVLLESVAEDKKPGTKPGPKVDTKPDAKPDTNFQSTSTGFVSPGAEPGLDAIGEPETFSPKLMKDLIPSAVDFIVSYACLPYTAAIRHPQNGGLYVQALCKHLNRNLEIDIALRRVNREVRRLWDNYYNRLNPGCKKYPRPDPFHIIMPPQKFLFLKKYPKR